ncbi:MAG: hypothetical protein M1820_004010 [Bogoriella megaspora]|nr:MAG: hypothetical protein M1820_004010 [Bogoriella megaspora]
MTVPTAKETHGVFTSIDVTKRSDRSIRMLLLQKFLFLLKTYLAKAKKHYPPQSNRLTPPKAVLKKCNVEERHIDGIYIYDMSSKKALPSKTEPETPTARRIYYFCGGGWQMPPSTTHWKTLAELERRLSEPSSGSKKTPIPTIISIISFPLAPASPAPVTFPKLVQLYETLMRRSHDAGEYVVIAGDSAGGNLACALVLHALSETRPQPPQTSMPREDDEKEIPKTNTPLAPHAILGLCPSVFLCRDANCEILKRVEKKDPLLSIEFITGTADTWVGKKMAMGRELRAAGPPEKAVEDPPKDLPEPWDKTDPRVSPLLGDMGSLARAGVRVHGTTGGYDLLSGDARKFREKCREHGVQGKWLEWDKQMHCWHLTWGYGLPEAKWTMNWLVDVLREEGP